MSYPVLKRSTESDSFEQHLMLAPSMLSLCIPIWTAIGAQEGLSILAKFGTSQ